MSSNVREERINMTSVIVVLQGGTLDMEDLEKFKVRKMDTWKVPLGEADLHVAPPPAGGALLAFILKLMKGLKRNLLMMFYIICTTVLNCLNVGERVAVLFSAEFSLTPDDLNGERKIRTYHHYIEVAKFANGQRRSIRDPQFNNPKV